MAPSDYKVFTQNVPDDKVKLLKKAAATYRANLKKAPRDFNAMHVLGLIECQLGNLDNALGLFEKALKLKPDFVDLQFLYGLALMEKRRFAEAQDSLKAAQALAPDNSEILYNLGCSLVELKQGDEALAVYMRVLALQPNHTEALNNIGNILNDRGQYQEAAGFYHRVLSVNAQHVMAHNNLGVSLTSLNDLEEAEVHLRQALALKQDYAEAWNNLGNIFRMQGKFAAAKACYEKALDLREAYAEARSNLGNATKDIGFMTEAIAHYRKALALRDDPEFRHNLALALLADRQWVEGWHAYEARWQAKQHAPWQQVFTQPLWHGEKVAGKTILLHSEQGFGDTIQFCRYSALVKERCRRVILQVQPELLSLMNSLQGVDRLIARGQDLPDFDLHCPLLSLPLAFQTTVETIPQNVPYLAAPEFAVTHWHKKLPAFHGKRIGLVWAGNGRGQTQDYRAIDVQRSILPEMFAPLIEIPNLQFYSLQKLGPHAPHDLPLIDFMGECKNFADTAALIMNLDLVISVDTAVVHLAGALGKHVWMLNRFNSCWRWLQDCDDSTWYPTLRQFRQPNMGDWVSVIEAIKGQLLELSAGNEKTIDKKTM